MLKHRTTLHRAPNDHRLVPEADRRRPLQSELVGAHDVFEIGPPEQQLVDLDVRVVIRIPDLLAIVCLRKEPRRAQNQARKAVVSVDDLAKVLGRRLRRAVHVSGHRGDLFGNPGSGCSGRWGKRPTERTRGAREHEATDAGRDGLLEQIERTGHVGVHRLLASVGTDMGLVQGRSVQDGVHAVDAVPHARSVDNRSHRVCVWRVDGVEPDDVEFLGAKDAHERLAEVAGAASDENPHGDRRTTRRTAETRVMSSAPATQAVRAVPALCCAGRLWSFCARLWAPAAARSGLISRRLVCSLYFRSAGSASGACRPWSSTIHEPCAPQSSGWPRRRHGRRAT
jgi:hypothetical protein